MRKNIAAFLCVVLLLGLCGCKKDGQAENNTVSPDTTVSVADTAKMDFELTERDRDSSISTDGTTSITLSGSKGSVIGSGAVADGEGIVIKNAGTYVLNGNMSGTVKVEAGDTDKIQLVLDGVTVNNPNGPALYIRSADKVFITVKEGSENSLSDGNSYTLTDGETTVDAALFSRSDLTINGKGKLTVNGNCKHGIISKDDLVISETDITVSAENVALGGKDCVKVSAATLMLEAGSDGIRSDNSEDADRGYITLENSKISITAENDGIQAQTVLKASGCDIELKTGGGSENSSFDASGGWNGNWMFGHGGGNTPSASEESGKGLKAGSDIIILSGSFKIDSADDSIHSNGTVTVSGGEMSLCSGDDGIHADTALKITDGAISITKSYEGIESSDIVITGGKISLVASDDGFNAAGGNDSSSLGGRPGMGGFSSSTGKIVITGGYMLVNASGDGIDSNGSITVSGGVVLVAGPTSGGNGIMDYDSTATVSGGTVVALGSNDMAQGFTDAKNQGAILISFSAQRADTSFALRDKSGKAVASFTCPKAYNCAVVSAAGIKQGETYSIVAGGTVNGADENGYSAGGAVSGGTVITEIEMTSLIYGTSHGMGSMGGGMGGGMRPGKR